MKKTNFPSEEKLQKIRNKLSRGIAARPLPKDADIVERTKHAICEKFVIYLNSGKIKQKELAEKLGIAESLVSKIAHYHYDEFTIDRLLRYLEIIQPGVEFKVA
jgi:predicted XRE-type DNA-binding protein